MSIPLHSRILIGGALGAAAGVAAYVLLGDSPGLALFLKYVAGPIGQIFLRLLFMLVIPLLFSALVLGVAGMGDPRDRKSTRLNSSHSSISYAVFCLKKKKNKK